MRTIVKYVMLDLLKNRIVMGYTLLLLVLSFGMFSIDENSTKGVLSLMNIALIFVPLISIIFSTIYVYNSAEFIELLVAQPLKRKTLWLSIYSGLALSLAVAFLIGVGVPVLIYESSATGLILVVSGLFQTLIFTGIALLASVKTRDKAKGIGVSILTWFVFTLIYDAIVMLLLFQFSDYPLEKPMIALTMLNPVDLSRILILLKLDISAMMGYTGAVFNEFFGGQLGMLVSAIVLLLWTTVPVWLSVKQFQKKDL
ncbi:Cu-processing system permease protein [Lacibacter cauensis]|uniref:Cu-processing system permease protein n=1 Tax=Lacibacter cauensis TaxID=510947 RepID=A0A562SAS2_9BACT|nr:ABC transporter permease subunit [Lacibacter cauensis]TWI78402.1 Cu-processing system permease protein [Lacibacter cauensis]